MQPQRFPMHYYEAVQMYAEALNNTLAQGEDPLDGLKLTSNLWNKTFQGKAFMQQLLYTDKHIHIHTRTHTNTHTHMSTPTHADIYAHT